MSGIGVCHISLEWTTCTAVGGIYVQGQEDALLQRCATSLSEKRVDVLLHLYTIKACAQICGEYIYIKCSTHVVCCRSNYHHSPFVTLDYVTCGEWFLIPWGKDQCSHKVSGSSQQMKQTIPNLLAPTSILLLLHNATVGAGARDYPNLMLTPPWWTMTMCLTPRKTRLGNMLSL